MRVSLLRFLIYVLLMTLLLPTGNGDVTLAWALTYYILMTWVTLLFMGYDGIRLKFWIPDIRGGILKGLKVFPLFFVVSSVLNFVFPVNVEPTSEKISIPLLFVVTVLAAPVAEEVMFRGYIQEFIRQRLKTEIAVLTTALIFSLFHPFSFFPQAFVTGVFLSALREYTNSILPGMVVHGLNNILAFVVMLGFSPTLSNLSYP